MLGIGEHEWLLGEDSVWAKFWKISRIRKFFKKPKCHYMYSLHTPMPKEGSLERRTFIHPVSCTASLSYSSEYNNFRENSMLSQGFPEGSWLVAKKSLLLCAVECWRLSTSVVSPASSPGLTPSCRLKIVIMMLLFVLPAAFPQPAAVIVNFSRYRGASWSVIF